MISGSLCGMFQSEEEHKRKRKLCATGSFPACVIFICLFYSLCIWLCLIWRLPPRIIPAAAEHPVDPRARTGAAPPASLQGLSTRCRLGENGAPQLLPLPPPTPVLTYRSSCSRARGMQNRSCMLQLSKS